MYMKELSLSTSANNTAGFHNHDNVDLMYDSEIKCVCVINTYNRSSYLLSLI